MSRVLFVLWDNTTRAMALEAIKSAPDNSRVEIKGPKRTLPQNSRMWAMLTDVSRQYVHMGQTYDADDWKHLFLHAVGRETRFVPALDGRGFVPIGASSSDLDVGEMSDLIECMYAWGAQNGIVWSEPDKGRPFAPLE